MSKHYSLISDLHCREIATLFSIKSDEKLQSEGSPFKTQIDVVKHWLNTGSWVGGNNHIVLKGYLFLQEHGYSLPLYAHLKADYKMPETILSDFYKWIDVKGYSAALKEGANDIRKCIKEAIQNP